MDADILFLNAGVADYVHTTTHMLVRAGSMVTIAPVLGGPVYRQFPTAAKAIAFLTTIRDEAAARGECRGHFIFKPGQR